MQKTNFTFETATLSRFLRNTRRVKQTIGSNRKKLLKAFRKHNAQVLSNPFGKAAAVAALSAMLHLSAGAQHTCDTFANADAASSIRSRFGPKFFIYATNFVDIDGDGDKDCYLTNNYSNTPILLENKGTAQYPLFLKKEDTGFGDDANGYIGYTSYVQFVDIDGDGDYDCFFSDRYMDSESDTYRVPLVFFENTGTPQKPHFVTNQAKNPLGNVTFNNTVPFQFADIDCDGDLDLYYYENGPFLSSPDYDVVIRNTGTKTNPVFTDTISRTENTGKRESRVYYDWNEDGRLDYFASHDEHDVVYYQNIGTKENPQYTDAITGPIFQNGAPFQIVDLNSDGEPEVFTASAHYSTVAPVAIIRDTIVTRNGQTFQGLYSVNTGAGNRYRWYRNGVLIPEAQSSRLRYRGAGVYNLEITNECGTGESLPYRVAKDTPVTAQNRQVPPAVAAVPGVSLQAYPNPFVSAVTVQLPGAAGTKSTIRVTDVAGRVMLSQTTASSSIQLGSGLSKGVYLLEVWQKDKVVFTTKLVKQ